MINGAEVLGRVQSGQVPPTWQVIPANKGYFTKNIIWAVVIIAIVLAGVLYLLANPLIAFTYLRGSSGMGLSDSELSTWRTIDFIVAFVVAAASAYWAYTSFRGAETAQYQVMVLMPEGVVIYKGEKEPEVIDFSMLNDLRIVKQSRSEDVSLVMSNAMTGKKDRVSLDGRFGKPRMLVQGISSNYQQYQAARLAGNPGMPPQGPGFGGPGYPPGSGPVQPR